MPQQLAPPDSISVEHPRDWYPAESGTPSPPAPIDFNRPAPRRPDQDTDAYVRLMNRLIMGLLGLTLAGTVLGMIRMGIRVRLNQALFLHAGLIAALFLGSRYYAWRGERRIYHVMLICFLFALTTKLHLFPMFLAGRCDVPFCDGTLAGWDKALGFEVPDILALVRPHTWLNHGLGRVYGSLILLITAAVLLAPLTGRIVAALENVFACIISVYIAFPIFALFQARGPWRFYGYPPLIEQKGYEAQLAALKALARFEIDISYAEGLICFPSYHTILAVLAAVALARIPRLWPVGVVWAALIVVSTVTTGSHYIVDVLAGLLVAGVSVVAARGFTALAFRRLADRAGSEALAQ